MLPLRLVQLGITEQSPFELVYSGMLRTPNGESMRVSSEALTIGRSATADITVDDAQVSGLHCEIVGTARGVQLRDLSSTNGTFVGSVRVVDCMLVGPASVRVGTTELTFTPAERREPDLSAKADGFGAFVGQTTEMRRLFQSLRSVAPTDLSVLVTGETGTGKELVARGIHDGSERANGPFVVVDCGALPSTLAESLLFGHVAGSFTGATKGAKGAFQSADGGTLFLDELGELPLDMQPKLLRAIAERTVKPLGAASYNRVDVRVVAATRRDLRREMNEQRFREDLYFRIAQVRIELPALRSRLADMPQLVEEACRRVGRAGETERVAAYIANRFEHYDWPGNVRELINVASVLASLGPDTSDALLPVEEAAGKPPNEPPPSKPPAPVGFVDAKRQFEHEYFQRMLRLADGNLSEVARRCGLARHNVRAHLRKLGLWT